MSAKNRKARGTAARLLAAGLGAGALAGCDTPNTRFADIGFGDATGLAAGGNLRLITERPRRMRGEPGQADYVQTVMCTEPSPDYLVTFDRTANGKLTGNLIANATTTLDGTASSNEHAGTNGEGRSAGVLALRDGLYAACQAYANGIIGQDAYSAILSQYGLLVAAVAAGPQTVVAPAAAGAKPAAAAPVMSPARAASAFSAVLVACLSAHDPSRPTPASPNRVLDLATCRQIVRQAGAGRHG